MLDGYDEILQKKKKKKSPSKQKSRGGAKKGMTGNQKDMERTETAGGGK